MNKIIGTLVSALGCALLGAVIAGLYNASSALPWAMQLTIISTTGAVLGLACGGLIAICDRKEEHGFPTIFGCGLLASGAIYLIANLSAGFHPETLVENLVAAIITGGVAGVSYYLGARKLPEWLKR